MEIIYVLLLIAILVIIINQNSKITERLQKLESEIRQLRTQLVKAAEEKKDSPAAVKTEEKKSTEEAKTYRSIFSIADEETTQAESDKLKATPEPVQQEPTQIIAPVAGNPAAAMQEKQTTTTTKKIPPKAPAPTFFERHPDMEKFIGENLVSKIGIGILVLAIGYFVKYAIDQNWIGAVARVSIGIFCGAVLTALAHKLRNTYKGFSSVMAGGGIAVFYFTITLAFQQFHLFSQTAAFIIMLVITLFAVVLAMLYDKQELAVIALVGGFAAPLLVSTGEGNYKVLFTYLIILNAGLLIIAYKKAWRLLNLLSFIFTVLMFGSWLLFLGYDEPIASYRNGFLFATVFYLLFLVINIAHNIKEKKKFIASDFGILLANTGLYFGAGIYCLTNMHATDYRGLFSASLGIFNLALSYFLFRKKKVDTNILYLLIGITLTFVSITAPIQLEGNYITIFWASEAVLLYWLFGKSKISIIQYASTLVWLLMLISLLMDWAQLYSSYSGKSLSVIINKGFITGLYAAMATYLLFIIRSKEDDSIKAITSKVIPAGKVFRITAIVLLFITGFLEIDNQFSSYYPGTGINFLYLFFYSIAFINIFIFLSQKIKQLQQHWYNYTVMFAACIFIYLVCINQTYMVQADMLTTGKFVSHFIAHWATAVLMAIVVLRLTHLLIKNNILNNDRYTFVTWALCIVTVTYLSVEVHLLTNNIFYGVNNSLENIQRIYIKTGLPILWGLCSFAFMWVGMRFKNRALRIISLSLFTLTLAKLFIFDIRNIPAGGKIAAFFSLGVLLLVVSFMYQRLKKIISDDEEKRV